MSPTDPPVASPVPSPCTGVCRIEPRTGWCAGCWRSLDEIAGWSTADETTKRVIWARLAERRAQAGAPQAEGRGA